MRCPSRQSGFTLVELLVSIAIALLLIVGVNSVFKTTSQTVGAGQSVLSSNRDARTILQTMLADLENVDPVPPPNSTVGDAPFFIIQSDHIYAFRNPSDHQSATSQTDPSSDSNLFKNFGGTAPVPLVHFRSHRVDRLAFFTRGQFARQTSSDANRFVSPTTGNEAMVVYGHSQQPNKAAFTGAGTWFNPGAGTASTNPFNFYAADWMLARMAIVLIPSPTEANYLVDNGGLTPLSANSQTTTGKAIYTSSSDFAATSIAAYATKAGGISSATGTWWTSIINYRLQASPFLLTSSTPKVNPQRLAQCAPNLIRGCSQFIVEYAGNFYTKNPDGSAVDTTDSTGKHVPVPDPTGQVDFFTLPGSTIHQTRWYGFPRQAGGTTGSVTVSSGNVVPARDVFKAITPAGVSPTWDTYADAERFANLSQQADYWSGMSSTASYTAAWGPDVKYMAFPKMIRVIIEVDDHEGRVNQPQRYEFIYDVQQ